MKTLRFLLLLALAPVLLALAPVTRAADQPAATPAPADGAQLLIKSIGPSSPAKLASGEKLKITIDYRNPAGRTVQIFARPYTKGSRTRGYGAHPSGVYRDLSGTVEGWFEFERASTVDEVRVEMIEVTAGGTRSVLATASLPIEAVWEGKSPSTEGSVPGPASAGAALATPGSPAAGSPAAKPMADRMAGIKEGAAIDIQFTAVDGREVDLAKLRGKVVLIDFWATWCGPCLGELPHVLEAYEKFHDQGFEIVGISFDQEKAALERLTKARGMTWPQYFDGKGWKNDFGVKYGIHGIPEMWLVDQQGRIASTNARRDLAGQVETLLAGKPLHASPAADAAAPVPGGAAAPAPAATPVALKIAEDVLRKEGVFGFPQAQATVFCDTQDLRFSVWSNDRYLYAQAILWKDGDAALGKTDDGRAIGDNSDLMLDVDADGKSTKDVDRNYLLNPWPEFNGLSYDICMGEGSTTGITTDTRGRGAIRYLAFPDGRKVRVDYFVVPLAEIARHTGDKIRVCYYGHSPKPELTVNAGGYEAGGRTYYSYNVPLSGYHEYTLAAGAELALESVPDGRQDPSPLAARHRDPAPQVGAMAPEIAAKEWLHAEGAPTLAGLRGQVVMVEFWATWCGPCIASIPHLNALQKKFTSRPFKIVSFTAQDRQGIDAFLRHTPMDYIIGTESDATFERYGITGIPAAFVVDKTGKIAWTGHSSDPALEAAIEAALGHD